MKINLLIFLNKQTVCSKLYIEIVILLRPAAALVTVIGNLILNLPYQIF